ncbi:MULTISPECIES: hypothetical protein [Nostoc]|uniref:hypothetical protein n=1 Tax=Nostoc TaxID=1177 RepID=UPI001F555510|nr:MULTISPECIES: hypothetical protein [Nostoc]
MIVSLGYIDTNTLAASFKVRLIWENIKNYWEESIVMTVIVAKWTIDEYHRMIDAGILSDRKHS